MVTLNGKMGDHQSSYNSALINKLISKHLKVAEILLKTKPVNVTTAESESQHI